MAHLNKADFDALNAAIQIDATAEQRCAALVILDTITTGIASPGLREAAQDAYGTDQCEIDDEFVSTSQADDGVWVQAWVWVAQDDDEEGEDA